MNISGATCLSRLLALSVPVLALLGCCGPGFGADYSPFSEAQAVWPEGREKERNITVGFTASFEQPCRGATWLGVTGATLYRVFLNGDFLGHGPARGPHGFYRVDEWNLSDRLKPGINRIAIEVAGYNANSYYLLDQPSFLQAEI